jgi:hypothetical protein
VGKDAEYHTVKDYKASVDFFAAELFKHYKQATPELNKIQHELRISAQYCSQNCYAIMGNCYAISDYV